MNAVNSRIMRIINDIKIATVAVGVIMFNVPLSAGGMYALTADENWYEDGKMMLADGAMVDLAGHKLTVGGFADYVPLDYVETDGTQWVHTEFTPEGTDMFELKFMKKQNTDEFLLCSRSNGSTDGFGVWVSGYSWKDIEFIYRSRGGVGFYGKSAESGNGIYDENGVVKERDYTVSLNGLKKYWVVNGATNDFSNTTNGKTGVTPSGPFALFGGHLAGASLSPQTGMSYMAKCRFYYLKVWGKDGNLKCNIIPAYGVREKMAGLYDTVRNKFMLPLKSGGEVTTFAKTYQVIDHVDTDGTQFVDTGFVHAWTNRIEMRAQMLGNSGYQALFGSRAYTSSGSFSGQYICWCLNSGFRFDYSGTAQGGSFNIKEECDIVMSPEFYKSGADEYWAPKCTVNGAAVIEHGSIRVSRNLIETGVSKRSSSCQLFAIAHNSNGDVGYGAKCRFYSLKIYNNFEKSKLLCDIVPAIGVNENEVGLYDRVRNRFMQSGKEPFPVSFAMTVTNSAPERATLEVTVADGVAVTNSSVEIAETGIDFVKSGGGSWICENGGLDIFGSFAFSGGTVEGVTMRNGATLDLSGRTTPLDFAGCGLSYAEDPSVYISIGNRRRPSCSAPLISWDSIPSVRFLRGDAERWYVLVSGDDGLYATAGFMITIK